MWTGDRDPTTTMMTQQQKQRRQQQQRAAAAASSIYVWNRKVCAITMPYWVQLTFEPAKRVEKEYEVATAAVAELNYEYEDKTLEHDNHCRHWKSIYIFFSLLFSRTQFHFPLLLLYMLWVWRVPNTILSDLSRFQSSMRSSERETWFLCAILEIDEIECVRVWLFFVAFL